MKDMSIELLKRMANEPDKYFIKVFPDDDLEEGGTHWMAVIEAIGAIGDDKNPSKAIKEVLDIAVFMIEEAEKDGLKW